MTEHKKIKNTGIIFELLVQHVTAEVLSGKPDNALKIIKEFFDNNTELSKELVLYHSLLKDKFQSKTVAEKLITEVLNARKRLNNSKLRNEKYNLVKRIKEAYNIDDFLSVKINNYKEYASIYKLFENTIGKMIPPTQIVQSRVNLVEHIIQKPIAQEPTTKTELESIDPDVRLLAYKFLIESFNKKYSTLNTKQKQLLRMYINSVNSSPMLYEYIESEIPKIQRYITRSIDNITDEKTKIRLNEVTKQINEFVTPKKVTEDTIVTLMKYYELMREIKRELIQGNK